MGMWGVYLGREVWKWRGKGHSKSVSSDKFCSHMLHLNPTLLAMTAFHPGREVWKWRGKGLSKSVSSDMFCSHMLHLNPTLPFVQLLLGL